MEQRASSHKLHPETETSTKYTTMRC